MRTRLFEGSIRHTRFHPTLRFFEYTYPMTLIDLDEAGDLARTSALFGWGRRRWFSVFEKDYFLPGKAPLKERLLEFLSDETTVGREIDRIELLTVPSFFGWGFNPVSFYFCRASDGSIPILLAEVNNTFRERHLYLLENCEREPDRFRSSTEKVFHVSPFFDLQGRYDFEFHLGESELEVRIDYHGADERRLSAELEGSLVPFTRTGLRRYGFRHPLVRLLTLARIHIQAARLYFGRNLPIHPKPDPQSRLTRSIPRFGWVDRLSRKILRSRLQHLAVGRLSLENSDGMREDFGSRTEEEQVVVQVRCPRFFRKTVLEGDVGFGESYVTGDWECPDLTGLIRLLLRNRDAMGQFNFALDRLLPPILGFARGVRPDTRQRARRNVSAHYDLSNEFFRLFLDPSMTYSCAYFPDPETSLQAAQEAKIDRILEMAEIRDSDRVLEIGSGWGALAKRLAERRRCEILSVTLSREQYDYAGRLIEDARLNDRVRIDYKDFREVHGLFDRIVSVEMLEAVGWKNLPVFFRTCQQRLQRDGKTVLQVITISERHFEAYRRGRDFIRKHIFPGGFLPSVSAIEEIVQRHTDFTIGCIEDIGLHYGATLREWRSRFLANQDRILDLGFDETFIRKWLYYFAYCEAAFDTRTLGVQQIVLERRS